MIGNEIFVHRGKAFGSKRSLHHIGHARASDARRESFPGLPPALVYKVRWGSKKPRLLVDPVDVNRLVRRHPKARVKVLSVA